jgi:hypothetical protein
MKKNFFAFLAFMMLGVTLLNTAQAQSPELIKYQAVLRDASGNVVANAAKTVVVNILQGSSSGTNMYQETHSVTTTAQGVINLNIGGGTVNSGTFSTINWSDYAYWAKLTVDAVEISNGQLLSVPYSLSVKGIDRDPANGNVTVSGKITGAVDGGACFQVGNDATLNDINYANGIGLYGNYDATIGHLKLGSAGPLLSGKTGRLGIGTTDPGYTLDVNGSLMSRGHIYANTGNNDATVCLGPGNKAAIGYAQNWSTDFLYINGWSHWTGTQVNGNELICDTRVWIYNEKDLVFKGYNGNSDYWFDACSSESAEDLRVHEGSSLRAYLQNGSNGWKTPSDKRLKDNIKTLSVLDRIDLTRGVSFTLKDSGIPQIGVIAQELKEAFPVAVSGSESTGMLGVDYNAVAAIALQGVKELKARVEALEKENAELKAVIRANK